MPYLLGKMNLLLHGMDIREIDAATAWPPAARDRRRSVWT